MVFARGWQRKCVILTLVATGCMATAPVTQDDCIGEWRGTKQSLYWMGEMETVPALRLERGGGAEFTDFPVRKGLSDFTLVSGRGTWALREVSGDRRLYLRLPDIREGATTAITCTVRRTGKGLMFRATIGDPDAQRAVVFVQERAPSIRISC